MKLSFAICISVFANTFLTAQSLCGFWKSNEYPCIPGVEYFETFAVAQNDGYITGTKILGDECVTSGEISFQGYYNGPVFPVIVRVGNPSNPNCCYAVYTMMVINDYHIVLNGTINLWKFSCDEVDSMQYKFSDYELHCDCNIGYGKVQLSPSPFTTQVAVFNNSQYPVKSIEILNAIGQRIYYSSGSQSFLNLEQLPAGVYIFNARTADDVSHTGTIIKTLN